jgi:putative transposase
MIEAVHADLSITAQCRLLSISRSSFYYAPQPESDETLALMRVIDAGFLDMPWYGSRQMVRHLRRQGVNIGRRRVRRLMAKMGLSPIYQRPRTSDPHPQHRIYPYLLRHLAVERPNHVWCADITPAFAGAGQASRCGAASCIWWRSWTGRPARCWPGGCQTRWTPAFA